jgi:hypothetical protein
MRLMRVSPIPERCLSAITCISPVDKHTHKHTHKYTHTHTHTHTPTPTTAFYCPSVRVSVCPTFSIFIENPQLEFHFPKLRRPFRVRKHVATTSTRLLVCVHAARLAVTRCKSMCVDLTTSKRTFSTTANLRCPVVVIHTHRKRVCVCVVAAQSPITTLNLKALAGMYSRCAIGRYSMQIHVCRSYNIKKDICYHSQSQVPVVHIHTDRKRVCV